MSRNSMWTLVGCGCLSVVTCAGLVLAAMRGFVKLGEKAAKPQQQFVVAIKEGRAADAYAQTSARYRAEVPRSDFEASVAEASARCGGFTRFNVVRFNMNNSTTSGSSTLVTYRFTGPKGGDTLTVLSTDEGITEVSWLHGRAVPKQGTPPAGKVPAGSID
jgi:hypothetical protein